VDKLQELIRIFSPLILLYTVGFVIVYTPFGYTLGVEVPIEALYVKISLVIVFCLLAVTYTYKQIDKIASSVSVSILAKRILVITSITLLLATPVITNHLGITY
jgi:hypothetical protein